MFEISPLTRREIILKFVELTLALLIAGLASGRLDTKDAHKTAVVHATVFICIAVCLVTISSSVLGSPVDERVLLVMTLTEAILFVVTGALYMEGFNPNLNKKFYAWPSTVWRWGDVSESLYCEYVGAGSIKHSDMQVMGAGIVAFVVAAVHALDFYFLFHICRSPNRPSVAAKRRGDNSTTA